jgi:hypothetical protein
LAGFGFGECKYKVIQIPSDKVQHYKYNNTLIQRSASRSARAHFHIQLFVSVSFSEYRYKASMRATSWSRIFRAIYILRTNASRPPVYRSPTLPARAVALRSMPTIPFLSNLFSSSSTSTSNMSYPVQKSNDEWQAVLNKGTPPNRPFFPTPQ